MKLKKLVWKRTAYSVINKSTKPIETQTWEAKTPLQSYKVYVSVGGGIFYQFGRMTNNYNGFPGYNSDADSILGKPKARCKSIKEGKEICEADWCKMSGAVLARITE